MKSESIKYVIFIVIAIYGVGGFVYWSLHPELTQMQVFLRMIGLQGL